MPQSSSNVDRDKVLKQGVDLSDVYQTLQAFMGGYFVNYFNRFGRQWQVYVQAEGDYRDQAEQLGQFYVRNNDGDMVPLARAHQRRSTARARSSPCATTSTAPRRSTPRPRPGYSSAQAMKALEEVFTETMPAEMGFDYLGMCLPGEEGPGGRARLRSSSASRCCSCS